ncbi:MAG: mechanosensitive ion channel family protein [Clostridia bacterium]|nr:mechanosensitive ion channel family protein [Clostridia bacterium]
MLDYRLFLAETGDSPVHEVVEEVGGLIEDAGARAGNFLSQLPMLTTHLLMAALAIFVGVVLIRIGRRTIASIVRMRGQKSSKSLQQISTVKSLVTSIFNYIAYFIIITIVLSIFGVNITSLLTLAGVGGIAISFGAQTLVKDIISGVFIWLEGSIAVGDVVAINDLSGVVESIAIRTTTVREYNGNIFIIPNGDIRTITNMSRDFKRAVVDIRCPYDADQERIVAILNEEMEKAGREIDGLTSVPEVMSILSFETDAVMVRLSAQCPVGEHWRIERDLRSRVKARFDKEGIEMPHYQKIVVKD